MKDVVCRLGGDEFVAFMRNIPQEAVERNIDAQSRKLHLASTELYLLCKVKVFLSPITFFALYIVYSILTDVP